MRITSFAVLTLLACGAAWAGTHPESATYIDGNLTGISPDTGATLSFTDDNGIALRTGLATVSIPYSGISHVELGAVQETSHDVPFYKVWALHRRSGAKSQTQLLIVDFKNDQDEQKNMTLELAKASIQNVLTAMESHAGKMWNSPPPRTPLCKRRPRNRRLRNKPSSRLLGRHRLPRPTIPGGATSIGKPRTMRISGASRPPRTRPTSSSVKGCGAERMVF